MTLTLRQVGKAFWFVSSRKKVWVSSPAGVLRFLSKLGWRGGSGARVSPSVPAWPSVQFLELLMERTESRRLTPDLPHMLRQVRASPQYTLYNIHMKINKIKRTLLRCKDWEWAVREGMVYSLKPAAATGVVTPSPDPVF